MRISKRLGANSTPAAETSSGCVAVGPHRAGAYFSVGGARVPGIAWIPDTMRVLDTVTADDADAGVDDQSDVIEPADAEADEAANDDEAVDEPAEDEDLEEDRGELAA